MKKQIFCFALLLTVYTSLQAQQDFTINGKISGLTEPSMIVLLYRSGGKIVYDSVLIENGQFVIKGKVDNTMRTNIKMVPADRNKSGVKKRGVDQQLFYLEGGNFTVDGNGGVETAVIKGGKTQSDYEEYKSVATIYQAKYKEKTQQLRNEKDEVTQKELRSQLLLFKEEFDKEVVDAFIYKHPDSYLSFDLIYLRSTAAIQTKIIGPLFNSLSERIRNSKEGKAFAARLELAQKTDIGHQAITFTQNNTEGKPVSLESLQGKFVLIDFWASWCGPCRKENPNVVRAYNKFKDKNFEILAVSLDNNKERWLKAIKDDGLPWIHVSDLKGWKNAVVVAYGVKAVPTNFLLDPNGVIIASNLRGAELEKKLEELIRN